MEAKEAINLTLTKQRETLNTIRYFNQDFGTVYIPKSYLPDEPPNQVQLIINWEKQ